MREIKLNSEDVFANITGESKEYPKYTTQVINLANQNAQGTKPNVVGQLSELLQHIPEKTYDCWKNWYLENHSEKLEVAKNRILDMVNKLRAAIELIDKQIHQACYLLEKH